MKEIFIAYLWENRLYQHNLRTVEGKSLEVLYPGSRNTDAGPDFLQARIRIGDEVWAGHVELHVNASDWYSHRHDADKGYDNVILHVVYQADKKVYTTSGSPVETLELKGKFDETLLLRYRRFLDSRNWIACEKQLPDVQRFTLLSWLDRMIVERLEWKVNEVLALFEKTGNDWEETLYRRLMLNFGFKVNNAPFLSLAEKLPFQLLLRHADQPLQLEALLFGVAGLLNETYQDAYPKTLLKEFEFLKHKYTLPQMDASQWRFMRMRPANFPTIRLSQMAAIVHQNKRMFAALLETKSVEEIRGLFEVRASDYWNTHFQFDKVSKHTPKHLGKTSTDLILMNGISQVLFACGHHHQQEPIKEKAMMLLESLDSEDNSIIRGFAAMGVVATNALQSQALLQMKQQYCDARRCLECRIGQLLVKSEHA